MTTPRRILLVEDSDDDVELITGTLSPLVGDRLDVVRDGAQALDYLERGGRYAGRTTDDPAVVVLDLKLPKLDGLEVLQRIRARPEWRTLPVVILTSSREDRDLARCYELGSNAYVVKPVRFEEFSEAVKGLGVFWGVLNELPSTGAR
jgi:CheY-like chemotaxis protein